MDQLESLRFAPNPFFDPEGYKQAMSSDHYHKQTIDAAVDRAWEANSAAAPHKWGET